MDNLLLKNNLVLKSSEDIHAKKAMVKTEGALLDEKLIVSEIRYRRLFETAKDGILILDFESGDIIDANPFIVKIIDFPIEEILGKKLWEIGLFSNKEESELAFTELKTNGYIRFEDMPIQRRNGKITEVEFISNVYLENKSKVIQCNIRDITDRIMSEFALIKSEQDLKKQNTEFANLNMEYSLLNEELKESIVRINKINDDLILAKEKAQESDKLKSAFLSNISHEIRTPMNAIIGFSDFLMQPDLPKELSNRYVQIIISSSQQLLSIISDIMDISKIESGQLSVDLKSVDIEILMTEIYDTYKILGDFKTINLVYASGSPDKTIQIKTDGNRIRQVICNLLNNAIKFTKAGEIQFGYTVQENFLEFYINDTGIGIDDENHELIFQRFRQVDVNDNQLAKGNGLGLAISKALVEKLGGTINVNSEPAIGSSFVFTIPR